jgi:hypothetical protein
VTEDGTPPAHACAAATKATTTAAVITARTP